MPHKIEVSDCSLCNAVVNEIKAGKCSACQLMVYSIAANPDLARKHNIRVVPTVIVDGMIKIEGRPDIPFVCSEETYAHFKVRYSLNK